MSNAELTGRLLTAEEEERHALVCLLAGRDEAARCCLDRAEADLAGLRDDLNARGLAIAA